MALRKVLNTYRSFQLPVICKLSTKAKTKEDRDHEKICSWQIHSYGEDVQLTKSRAPIIMNPDDVLVEVSASSVNPIDIAMMNGYGATLLNKIRQAKACSFEQPLEFPLTLGRDFSGIIIGKGHSVKSNLKIGDEVWGVVPPHAQGCHSEQVVTSQSCVFRKPNNISMIEAGSILYAAVTAWSALKISGDLALVPANNKTVLVIGGSGGVGSFAVQMLKSWGANVVATCSTDAVPLVESFGASEVIDYSQPDAFQKIERHKYDIILDCAGIGQDKGSVYCKYLKDYKFSKFITLRSPMLKNVDELGLVAGMIKNVGDLVLANLNQGLVTKSSSVRWAFFMPVESAIEEITKDVENKKIVPSIHKVFDFKDVPDAYQLVKTGHLRGKVVINIASNKVKC